MQKNTASDFDSDPDFDFDDWAGLYIENPEEFEARRQATLIMEVLHCAPEQADPARQLLDSYDHAMQGRSPVERMNMAAVLMKDSLHQLRAELQILKQALESLEAVEAPTESIPGSRV